MIKHETLRTAMYEAMKQAATVLPPDVEKKLKAAYAEENEPLAKQHLQVSLENARLAGEGKGLVCGDTGFPLYFIKAGKNSDIEGGFQTLWTAAREATAQATAEAFLRPTMVDPLNRSNPGDNIGPGMPKVELSFDDSIDGLEIVAAPKGGGSEIFGTFYRMLFPADGVAGIKKFVIECIKDACYAGKICPPAIVGVGIGGTADLCVKMAKEAALLRPLGTRHEREDVADLEEDLLTACRELGIGPMGARGINCVMGLHCELAVTHTAALPVAVNAQCLVGRRWKAIIDNNNKVQFSGDLKRVEI
jgi:tartrate/fumarate subfamily iron-sulfur-dependent hydro-lyase alpha chain